MKPTFRFSIDLGISVLLLALPKYHSNGIQPPLDTYILVFNNLHRASPSFLPSLTRCSHANPLGSSTYLLRYLVACCTGHTAVVDRRRHNFCFCFAICRCASLRHSDTTCQGAIAGASRVRLNARQRRSSPPPSSSPGAKERARSHTLELFPAEAQ
ncbi:hypothetical protein F4802DRAFT_568848 [Xylaria palmicola]|nr:hypothetical protein F4802DRAFT_568848 [Xylaria palmicola]